MTNHYKSIIAASVVLFTMGNAVTARHLTPDAALARINNSPTVNFRIKKAAIKARLVHTRVVDDVSTIYVYNQRNNDGFLILSADDTAPAVLGYSDTGALNPENMPPGLEEWMNDLSADIGYAAGKQNNLRTSPKPDNEWEDIGPMLTTTWDQGDPYNAKCPEVKYGTEKCLTGCGATAMAQIMNYHKWPKQGVGEKTYRLASRLTKLTANFSETTYDWAHMADHYNYKDLSYDEAEGEWTATQVTNTPEEKTAVATLMYHLGVVAEMNYGSSVSSSAADAFEGLMTQYFDYAPDHRFVYRNKEYNGKDDEWEELIYNELAEGRPVFYTGHSSAGGHGFVCDGYRKEIGSDGNTRNYFHFNWGWSGMGDGYYLVTAFYDNDGTPLCPPEYCTGVSGMHFSQNQGALIGLRPNNRDYIYSEDTPSLKDADGNVVTDPVAGKNYLLCLSMINGSTREVTYYFGMELYNKEYQSSQYIMSPKPHTMQPGEALSQVEITWPSTPESGDYDIIPCYATSFDATEMARIELPEGTEPLSMALSNDFDFHDGSVFDLEEDTYFSSVTYHRKFYSNVWNSWYLPFAVNTEELAENHLTAAILNGVHQYDDDGDGVFDRATIEILNIKNGTLRAATPYFVKPDAEYNDVVVLSGRMVNKASEMHKIHTETTYAMYDFMGTYTKIEDGHEQECYIMAKDGGLRMTNSYVPAVDWYMQITPKESPFDAFMPVTASSKMVITVIGEEDEATGIKTIYDQQSPKRTSQVIYNLQGAPVGDDYKGVVIVNGKKMMRN